MRLFYAPPGLALKTLRSAHTVCLCVLCGSQNKQQLLPYTSLTEWILSAFAKLRKANISFVMSVCLSVLRPHGTGRTGRIFVKFNIRVFFENLLRNFKFHVDLKETTGTLREDRYVYIYENISPNSP